MPHVISGWNDFTIEQQYSMSQMNNFFCGLHFLVALANSSAEVLKEWEAFHLNESDGGSSGESGTVRLVRTVCKAVQK